MSHEIFIERVELYKRLLEAGENLKVIEEFYDDNIVQVEFDGSSVEGRDKCLELEQCNLRKVSDLKSTIPNIVMDADKEKVLGEMMIAFDSREYGRSRIEEAFVQQWRNGRIIYQRFYFHTIYRDQER